MFKLIGGVVVFGFALYGLVTFIEQQKAGVAIRKSDPPPVAMATAPSVDAEAAHSNGTASLDEADAEPSVA